MTRLTININRKIRRRVLDDLPSLFYNPAHPDLVNLMRFNDPESDVLVDFVILGTLGQ